MKVYLDNCCFSRPFDSQNQSIIREKGLKALKKELGPVGTVYFIRQFYSGSGNYTEERRALQNDISIEEIADRIAGTRR